MDKSKRSFRIMMIALVIFGSLLAAYDLYEIIAGKVDLNRHLPFLLPGVIFALTWIFYRTERLYDKLDALRKQRGSAPLPHDNDGDIS